MHIKKVYKVQSPLKSESFSISVGTVSEFPETPQFLYTPEQKKASSPKWLNSKLLLS